MLAGKLVTAVIDRGHFVLDALFRSLCPGHAVQATQSHFANGDAILRMEIQ